MRDLFHVPDNYFLTHSVGCLPRSTEAALHSQYFAAWASGTNWQDWMPVLDQFRLGLAALLGVDKTSICPQINISSALTKILYSLPPPPLGQNIILLSKQDFPTIGFVFKQAERMGYRLKFIDGNPAALDNWDAAIDETIAVVHITHALSNTSHLLPVGGICRLARRVNAVSIVDIAQSFGVVPIALSAWKADFAIGTGVKFLCCGPGSCFLYAAPHILALCRPIDVGWFSHENPFEMDIQNFQYADNAMRFFGGTPSPSPLVMANSAVALWQSVGVDTAHKHIQTKLTWLCEQVPHDIIVSPIDAGKRGGTLVINPINRDPLRQRLAADNILHDERAEGFRFSLHGYTSDQEVETLSKAILAAHKN